MTNLCDKFFFFVDFNNLQMSPQMTYKHPILYFTGQDVFGVGNNIAVLKGNKRSALFRFYPIGVSSRSP